MKETYILLNWRGEVMRKTKEEYEEFLETLGEWDD